MAENPATQPTDERPAKATRPPSWAPGFLMAALPIAVLLSLSALFVAAVVFPLFDLTPIFVLAVTLVCRRWDGVLVKRFTAPAVLAALLLLEWIAWDAWYYFVAYLGDLSTYGFDTLVSRFGSPVVVLLLVQMVALLVLFGRATVPSYRGVKRARSQG